MKRFVAYIYGYNNGIRSLNAGHLKVEVREECCRLAAHVRLRENENGIGKIFLVTHEPTLTGLPAGELILSNGQGHVLLDFPKDKLEKEAAFVVMLGGGRLLAAGLSGEPGEAVTSGAFPIWSLPAHEPEPPDISYKRIGLTDLLNLPGKNRLLCRNSFLVHGFFNYHYLVIKTLRKNGEEKSFVGVPGLSSPPEARMAEQYGFTTYEEDSDGQVGCWLRPL